MVRHIVWSQFAMELCLLLFAEAVLVGLATENQRGTTGIGKLDLNRTECTLDHTPRFNSVYALFSAQLISWPRTSKMGVKLGLFSPTTTED